MSTQTLQQHDLAESKGMIVSLWIVQIGLAGMFFMAGGSKLAGSEQMVQVFSAIDVGQWFRYVTGAIEVGSALLLLTPAFSGLGAFLLVGTMTGALITHLFILGGNPSLPITLLVGALFVAWGRRHQILKFIGR